jgi:hypothetical protein
MALVGVLYGGGRPSAFQDVAQRTPSATSARGFPGAAKRATIAGMSWHHIPKDDAWKQAHLAMLVKLPGKRASLHLRCLPQPISISTAGLRRSVCTDCERNSNRSAFSSERFPPHSSRLARPRS